MSLWNALFGEPVETTPDWYARERAMMAAQSLQNDPRYVSESEQRIRALEARVAELEKRLGLRTGGE